MSVSSATICRVLAILITAGVAAACSERTEEQVKADTNAAILRGVTKVTLEDGTRCVIVSGGNGFSGIDCNWNTEEK